MDLNDIGGMTVKYLWEAKGNRTIAYVQVAGEEEAVATSAAGMGAQTYRIYNGGIFQPQKF
jgi:hypothetical protein